MEVEDNPDFDRDFEETAQSAAGEGEAPGEQVTEGIFMSRSEHRALHPLGQRTQSESGKHHKG